MSVQITFTVPDSCADVLDALAFFYEYGGKSPRSSLVRETMVDLCASHYASDPDIRRLVEAVRERRATSAARHPARHLRVVR